MEAQLITSKHNPKINVAFHLRRKKVREEKGLFIIEGARELQKALSTQTLQTLFICQERLSVEAKACIKNLNSSVEKIECSSAAFNKICMRETSDGILAIAQQKKPRLEDLPKGSFFLLIEGVEKPGNLGAIFRTCDGLGIDGVLIVEPNCDPYNPNVIRSSVGSLFTVPWAQCSQQQAQDWLEQQGITLVATMPDAQKQIQECDLTKPVCLLFGSESHGLSSYWEKASVEKASIPMFGKADSFNLAVSCVICAYETRRQRLG